MGSDEDTDDERNFETQPPNAIFTLGGVPVLICLHVTMSPGARQAMAKKILEAGGDPTADLDEARVVICPESHPAFKQLVRKFEHERFKWVEPPSWVDMCIRDGVYEHHDHRGNLKGRRRCERVAFSPSDKMHLIEFLANRAPFKNQPGGRLGNELYRDLCHPDRAQQYPWARRHTWQSWRNHYKQNQDILDPKIQAMVDSNPFPPEPGEKGQYIPDYGAKTSTRERRKRSGAKQIGYEFEPGESDDFEEEERDELEEAQPQVVREEDVVDNVRRIRRRSRSQEAFDDQDEDLQALALETNENNPPQKKARTMRQGSIDFDNLQGSDMPGPFDFDSPSSPEHDTPTPGPSRPSQMDLPATQAVLVPQANLIPTVSADIQNILMSSSQPQRTTQNKGKGKGKGKERAIPVATLALGPVTRRRSKLASTELLIPTRMTRARASAERELAGPSKPTRNSALRAARGRGRGQASSSRGRGQMLPPIRDAGLVTSASLGTNASAREETQVEQILQPIVSHNLLEGGTTNMDAEEEDSGSGESSDDQQTNELLRRANEQRQRVMQSESRHVTPGILQSSPQINVSLLPPETTFDPDPTPKPKHGSTQLQYTDVDNTQHQLFEKKNMKIRKMPHTSPGASSVFEPSASEDARDSQSVGQTSESGSIPVEDTKAYTHKGEHRRTFTPAPGTKAEAHINSLSATRGKGKDRDS